MSAPLSPGSVIGILGGGQLGQMLALAAARLGFRCYIYSDTPHSPATHVGSRTKIGAYGDIDSVLEFAKKCDVLTYEFENVPAKSAKAAAVVTTLRPGAKALDIAQDRLIEKTFISKDAGVDVTPFYDVTNQYDLKRALHSLQLPIVLKTRRLGYDGKGQYIIRKESDIPAAFKALGDVPVIAESFIKFRREVSVIAARTPSGETATYPLIENVHKNHVLHISSAPAARDDGRAQTLALKIMDALDYVGVMATEFFECDDGSLLVNEIAPRVHNSGHWTQNAGCTDQFEQHIRAIAGWPLGGTEPAHTTQMLNLLGDDIEGWETFAKDPKAHLHLYGKSDMRPGRKMGHVNRILE